MRIGFDVTSLAVTRSGVGTYTANLLDHLRHAPDDVLVPLAHRPVLLGPTAERVGRGRRLNKTFWMQAVLPRELDRLGIEIAHFTNGVAPLVAPCPIVLTVHDMTLWLYPRYHPLRRLLTVRPILPLAVRRASAIVAVSQSAKRDLVRILGVPPERVHVVHSAAAPCFRPLPLGAGLDTVRQAYGLPDRFVLFVGSLEPRKNLVRLLEAFARLDPDLRASVGLVLAGPRGWKDTPIFEAVQRLGIAGSVRFLGYVPSDRLVELYNLAEVLAFPSLYEGFGLPVVEAMACGTAVLTTRRGGLAEAAGEAAEFVEPLRVESIQAGLERVLRDSTRRDELRALGLAQASRFSWAATATSTRHLYQMVADGAQSAGRTAGGVAR